MDVKKHYHAIVFTRLMPIRRILAAALHLQRA